MAILYLQKANVSYPFQSNCCLRYLTDVCFAEGRATDIAIDLGMARQDRPEHLALQGS